MSVLTKLSTIETLTLVKHKYSTFKLQNSLRFLCLCFINNKNYDIDTKLTKCDFLESFRVLLTPLLIVAKQIKAKIILNSKKTFYTKQFHSVK
jgi:hypothetical protein